MHTIKYYFDEYHQKALPVTSETMDEVIKTRKQKRIYWICQVSGWAFYAVLNILGMLIFDKFVWGKVYSFFFLCIAGIGLTHLLRNYITSKGWLSLHLKQIIPRVLLSSIIIGAILFVIFLGLNLSAGVTKFAEIKPAAPLIWTANLSSVILAWLLIYFSVNFFENYKRAEIESLIWEAAVKDFELKTLKSQLNPHFMFNAMNSIRALIEEDPENAKTALTKLSNILRYSLKIERTETVPLEEEIQTVADYLDLEQIRYEERLSYVLDIDPKSNKIEIPPMMIQTLVENGIKHGISKRKSGGTIKVSTLVNGSELTIKICNSGSITDQELRQSDGFGINNTKHRLNLLYGEKGTFSINNSNENEVSAEIKIPTGGK